MKAKVEIDAGVCGFCTTARVTSEDGQNVVFNLDSNCDKILQLGQVLQEKGPVDAYQEINPGGPAVIMTSVKEILTGCCAGCAVPVGLFKAMQVAAGLALPKGINIKIAKE
ncbi:MAG: hypothetical protein MUO22_06340 [Sedimentisphaerales bacterium]|nr:hypothetical protein [Sedimentisphaerales bacterium]